MHNVLHWMSLCVIDFSTLLKRYEAVLSAIAAAHMEFTQLQAFLSSQTKKREVGLMDFALLD